MLPLLLSLATDPVPTDNSVKAGWTAFAVFLLLLVAIVFLGWSFSRQLKKVKKAHEEGVYGDPAPRESEAGESDAGESHLGDSGPGGSSAAQQDAEHKGV